MGARATISSCAKMYPWPDYELNLAGLIAANFLPLIFIFAFLSTTVRGPLLLRVCVCVCVCVCGRVSYECISTHTHVLPSADRVRARRASPPSSLLPSSPSCLQTLLLKSLVAEKELRLREGMQMMGLQSSMYWLTWFCTHFSTLMITMLACTVIGEYTRRTRCCSSKPPCASRNPLSHPSESIQCAVYAHMANAGIYPFAYTDTGLMFVFLVFWAISLIMFCYFLSTLFNRSVPSFSNRRGCDVVHQPYHTLVSDTLSLRSACH